MVAVPNVLPVTTPVNRSMLATPGLLLVQVANGSVSLSVMVNPIHTCVVAAVIGLTAPATFTVVLTLQPVADV